MIPITLTNQVAVITGAGGGIGAGCAKRFAEAGANVVLVGRTFEKLEAQAKEIASLTGSTCLPFQADISKEKEFEAAMAFAEQNFSKIDILVNAAGIALRKPVGELSQQEIDTVFDTNTKSVLYGCRVASKRMIPNQSGVIINVSSIAARLGQECLHLYAASKAAVLAINQSLAREFAPYGIRVNAVLPGHVLTPMWEKELENMSNHGTEEEKQAIFSKILKEEGVPLGRPQTTEDIANTIVFLASDLARNITAQTIAIDGGCTTSF